MLSFKKPLLLLTSHFIIGMVALSLKNRRAKEKYIRDPTGNEKLERNEGQHREIKRE